MITVTTEARGTLVYVYSTHSSNLISLGNEVLPSEVDNEIANQADIINNYINNN